MSKKHQVKYKKAPQAPRRFKSSYMFFSTEKHRQIREERMKDGETEKLSTTEVAKMVSQVWKDLSNEEREVWEDMARKDKARYEMEKSMYTGPWKVPAKKRTQKDPNAPRRPMSAFLSFSNSRRSVVKSKNADAGNAEISRMLAQMWKDATEAERKEHIDKEFKLRQEYKVAIAEWRKNSEQEIETARKEREDLAMKAVLEGKPLHHPGGTRRPVGGEYPHTEARVGEGEDEPASSERPYRSHQHEYGPQHAYPLVHEGEAPQNTSHPPSMFQNAPMPWYASNPTPHPYYGFHHSNSYYGDHHDPQNDAPHHGGGLPGSVMDPGGGRYPPYYDRRLPPPYDSHYSQQYQTSSTYVGDSSASPNGAPPRQHHDAHHGAHHSTETGYYPEDPYSPDQPQRHDEEAERWMDPHHQSRVHQPHPPPYIGRPNGDDTAPTRDYGHYLHHS